MGTNYYLTPKEFNDIDTVNQVTLKALNEIRDTYCKSIEGIKTAAINNHKIYKDSLDLPDTDNIQCILKWEVEIPEIILADKVYSEANFAFSFNGYKEHTVTPSLTLVNKIHEKAKEMAEELLRKVTVAELAKEMGIEEEEIFEAIRLSANHMDYIEEGSNEGQ